MSGTASDPTAGLPLLDFSHIFGGPQSLTADQLKQWASYFGDPGTAYSGAPAQNQNQMVQTGATWSPAIPWLTAAAGGTSGGLGAAGNQSFTLPIQSLGIQPGANATQTAANVANSPYAGNPSNPYYREILNQVASGTFQPTYAPAPAAPASNPAYAQMIGGQLIGNLTPEEQQLASYFNLGPTQYQYLPGVIGAALGAPAGNADTGPFNRSMAVQNYLTGQGFGTDVGGPMGQTPQQAANYQMYLSNQPGRG